MRIPGPLMPSKYVLHVYIYTRARRGYIHTHRERSRPDRSASDEHLHANESSARGDTLANVQFRRIHTHTHVYTRALAAHAADGHRYVTTRKARTLSFFVFLFCLRPMCTSLLPPCMRVYTPRDCYLCSCVRGRQD